MRTSDPVPAEHTLVLPAFVEPHAHLDKAFLAETVPNPSGDLSGAIRAMEANRHLITFDDTVARAERAARLMFANGTTVIRTHADATLESGLVSVEALLTVRERLRDIVTIQVAVLCGWPSTGVAGAEQRALLRAAIDMGIDVVGGCPHLEDDPNEATDNFLAMAADAGLPVDLHTDETLDPAKLALGHLAERVISTGFAAGVTASHCVSLGVQSLDTQRRIAERVATAGISVVVLPHTNLFLQGRAHHVGMPRALAPIAVLRRAGVNVAAGADNLQDPFNPVGRGDPLETASLLVMAGHLLPEVALEMVTTAGQIALGVPQTGDEVLVAAATVREAIAFGPAGRVVRHGHRNDGPQISHASNTEAAGSAGATSMFRGDDDHD